MLVRFSVQNWMSFRHATTFSMVASKERQHGERLANIAKYKAKLLPVAAIYGGNASGKTNFFRALSFAKELVVRGTLPDNLIAVEPFRLSPQSSLEPTRFQFELLVGDEMYEYCFSVTRKEVVEERLTLISAKHEQVLFDRRDGSPNFGPSLQDDAFLQFAFKGTRDNQLFLTNSVSQRGDQFRPVFNWFKDTLELIAPDSRFAEFQHFLDDTAPLSARLNKLLQALDTGICELGAEELAFDDLPIGHNAKTQLQQTVPEGEGARFRIKHDCYLVSRENGELKANKLVAFHKGPDGGKAKFDMSLESDGTRRVIELLPHFIELEGNSSKVYVIDELDRSLHTLLTRQLLELHLSQSGPDSRSQLLFTTHDVLLMNQDIFRRDEMWVAERDDDGSSTLSSFSDFKDVRYDKDIRKSYLQGRLGGIPRLLLPPKPHEAGHGKN